jgi:hypothetical protein
MPDISMCQNKLCPKKAECYRYTAKPSMRQSYCAFEYKDGCEHYMPNQLELFPTPKNLEDSIPKGRYCYESMEMTEDGTFLQLGTCPYWKPTNHGTVRCEYMKEEQLVADSSTAYEQALEFFGSRENLERETEEGVMWDQVKECGEEEV